MLIFMINLQMSITQLKGPKKIKLNSFEKL